MAGCWQQQTHTPGTTHCPKHFIKKKSADTLLLCHKIHVLPTMHIFRSPQNKTDVSKVNAYICCEMRCRVRCRNIEHEKLRTGCHSDNLPQAATAAVAMTVCCNENRQYLYCDPNVWDQCWHDCKFMQSQSEITTGLFIGRTCRQPSFPRWKWVPGVMFLTFLWSQSGGATPSWAVINTISPLFLAAFDGDFDQLQLIRAT